jgi:phosphoribosylformimino-5-aminoimidazole carboxamide ribotide isomerase
MDLMHAQVVRGVGGRRDEYRPIQSILCNDARPITVARAFAELGFRQLYVADLDAIQKGVGSLFPHEHTGVQKGVGSRDSRPPSWSIYEVLMRAGLDLWIDAGLTGADDARELAAFEVDGRPIAGIVAGLESLADPQALADMCDAVGPVRLVFSLDLKLGVPLVGSPAWNGLSPQQIAAVALRAGVRRMIVLDLANVGMSAGVSTIPLCRALRCLAPELQIIAGGGVRGPADLDALARAGCDAALVASALHDGRLSAAECAARSTRTIPGSRKWCGN